MTATELNKDVKKLLAKEISLCKAKITSDEFYTVLEAEIKPEFKRLYLADTSFKSFNRASILTMFRLNLKYRFLQLHSFGILIELNEI
jgi:hypothetical protein